MPSMIREARPADLPAVAELFDLYRQFYKQAPDAEGARAFIAARQARQESVILLAETGTGPLALLPALPQLLLGGSRAHLRAL
jgi:hypothetical protein